MRRPTPRRPKPPDYTVARRVNDALTVRDVLSHRSVRRFARHSLQEHQHPAEAARIITRSRKLKNPVPPTPRRLPPARSCTKQCASCHGETGKGDGKMGVELDPKPSDLTDADWKHGSTDGEIFTVIRDGSKATGMKPYAAR